jgi:hypothetical protein
MEGENFVFDCARELLGARSGAGPGPLTAGKEIFLIFGALGTLTLVGGAADAATGRASGSVFDATIFGSVAFSLCLPGSLCLLGSLGSLESEVVTGDSGTGASIQALFVPCTSRGGKGEG